MDYNNGLAQLHTVYPTGHIATLNEVDKEKVEANYKKFNNKK